MEAETSSGACDIQQEVRIERILTRRSVRGHTPTAGATIGRSTRPANSRSAMRARATSKRLRDGGLEICDPLVDEQREGRRRRAVFVDGSLQERDRRVVERLRRSSTTSPTSRPAVQLPCPGRVRFRVSRFRARGRTARSGSRTRRFLRESFEVQELSAHHDQVAPWQHQAKHPSQ